MNKNKKKLVLAKIPCLIGMLGTNKANLGNVISEGGCCDLGNFSRTHLSSKQL